MPYIILYSSSLRSPEAAKWSRRLAARGGALDILEYVPALEEGKGVRKDPVAAYAWIVVAQEVGFPNDYVRGIADALSSKIEPRLSAGQKKEAQRLAQQFQSARH